MYSNFEVVTYEVGKYLNKNPTDLYQKQIQQALQKCDSLIEKGKHRYLMNIRPTAPKLNAYIKKT